MASKSKAVLLEGVTGIVKSKKIGCNTLAVEFDDGRKAVRYHKTNVITDYPNGNTTLDCNGWRTVTTKVRFNSRFQVWADKGVWYIKEPATGKTLPYFDGITFDSTGKVVGEVKEYDFAKIKAVKAKIAKYIKLVDNMKTIPMPDSGDCWFCLMKTNEGKSWGDVSDNHSHLESHLDEGYIFGSIIYNALAEKGYQDPGLIMYMKCKTSIKDALRRYLTKRLLPEVQAK
jgi:hypothetical protein